MDLVDPEKVLCVIIRKREKGSSVPPFKEVRCFLVSCFGNRSNLVMFDQLPMATMIVGSMVMMRVLDLLHQLCSN